MDRWMNEKHSFWFNVTEIKMFYLYFNPSWLVMNMIYNHGLGYPLSTGGTGIKVQV